MAFPSNSKYDFQWNLFDQRPARAIMKREEDDEIMINCIPFRCTTIPALCTLLGLLATSCGHTVDVKPIRVEPIHVTMDVNIRVDKELDQFFAFEEELQSEVEEPAVDEAAKPETSS